MKDNEQKIKAVPLLRGPRTCEAVTGAAQLSIQPRFLTKANALAVSGASLRWWCEHYPHLVRHVGKKARHRRRRAGARRVDGWRRRRDADHR